MLSLMLAAALASPCDPLIAELRAGDGVLLSWWSNPDSDQFKCVARARQGLEPELLRALDAVPLTLVDRRSDGTSKYVLSSSVAAAQLRCDLRTSSDSLERGLASAHWAVAAACLVNAAVSRPALVAEAPLEGLALDDFARAIDRLDALNRNDRALLGPLLERAEALDAPWKVPLMVLVCTPLTNVPLETCDSLAAREPYGAQLRMGRARAARDEAFWIRSRQAALGRHLIATSVVIAIDAALMVATTLLRNSLGGQIMATISTGIGVAPLGALLGGLIMNAAHNGRGSSVFWGTFAGLLIGALGGAVAGALLTQAPGDVRPVTAGVGLGIGTAVMIPLIWIF